MKPPYTLPELAQATGYTIAYLQTMAAQGRIRGAVRDPRSKRWLVHPPAAILAPDGELRPFHRRASNKRAEAPASPSTPQRRPYA